MAGKPSKPRLKREFICQVELGPYLGGEKKRLVAWFADLEGINARLGVVQQVNTNRLSDEKRNPVLAKRLCDESNTGDPVDVCKHAYRFAQDALYHVVERELRLITRPMVRVCGDEKPDKDSSWHTFEPGNSQDVLGRWRAGVLAVLANQYGIMDLTDIVASFDPSKDTAQESEPQADVRREGLVP